MTIRKALETGIEKLKKTENEDAALDVCVLLCTILEKDKAYIYAHPESKLSEENESKFLDAINARCDGMPVAYITGGKEFMSLPFEVSPGVLIPRPETELLAETVISYISKKQANKKIDSAPLKVLDIGTGSGCVAVSIARFCSGCSVTATDISPEAEEITKRNAITNKVDNRIEVINSDLFSNLFGRKFDIIVSNPPYICRDDLFKLKRDVIGFEPRIALDGGREGLEIIKKIITEAPLHLNSGGLLAIEIGIGQQKQTLEIMGEYFSNIWMQKDLSGIPRVIAGIKL
jgi:release factor glutamine methyltransferase